MKDLNNYDLMTIYEMIKKEVNELEDIKEIEEQHD